MQKFKNIRPGTITKLIEDGFDMKDSRDQVFRVIITSATRFPHGTDFHVSDLVVVMGEQKDNLIKAYGIDKVNPEMMPRGPLRMHFYPRFAP